MTGHTTKTLLRQHHQKFHFPIDLKTEQSTVVVSAESILTQMGFQLISKVSLIQLIQKLPVEKEMTM
jgi:hypothetical protein